jgi:hypothetical protein
MICASVYLLGFIQNLLVHRGEKILLMQPLTFGGDYPAISTPFVIIYLVYTQSHERYDTKSSQMNVATVNVSCCTVWYLALDRE